MNAMSQASTAVTTGDKNSEQQRNSSEVNINDREEEKRSLDLTYGTQNEGIGHENKNEDGNGCSG